MLTSEEFKKGMDELADKFAGSLEQVMSKYFTMGALQNKFGPDGTELDTTRDNDNSTSMQKDVAASAAQAEVPYDSESSYDTLRDPRERSKPELDEYVRQAVAHYKSGNVHDVHATFCEDFIFWDKKHFQSLTRNVCNSLRDVLLENGAKIVTNAHFESPRTLGEYIHKVCIRSHTASAMIIERSVEHGTRLNTTRNPSGTRLAPTIRRDYQESAADEENPYEYSESNTEDNIQTRMKRGRPSEVGKLFRREQMYSGSPIEPLRRRFSTFINIAKLCEIDAEDKEIMFPLMEATFLKDQALLHFQDIVRDTASCVDEAIDLLEAHFLGHRARRVNDEIWDNLSYDFMMKKYGTENKTIRHEAVLKDLLCQIADLADIRTGPGSDTIIMAKTIAAVRNIDVYSVVCQNPPAKVQELNSVLRSCALEADRAAVKSGTKMVPKLKL